MAAEHHPSLLVQPGMQCGTGTQEFVPSFQGCLQSFTNFTVHWQWADNSSNGTTAQSRGIDIPQA